MSPVWARNPSIRAGRYWIDVRQIVAQAYPSTSFTGFKKRPVPPARGNTESQFFLLSVVAVQVAKAPEGISGKGR